MRRIFILLLLLSLLVINSEVFAKPKKIKCKKPIYFFENVNKNDYFNALDELLQQNKYNFVKFYPELGFISLEYKVSSMKKTTETVAFSLKQFGNDVYLFIDISKGNTKLEKQVYTELKKTSKNSYLIKDDLLCRDLSRDVTSINKNRHSTVSESDYNPKLYKISMHRYVGYNKKVYFKDKLAKLFHKKKKDKKQKV